MSSNKVIFETKTDHTEASAGKDVEGIGQLRLENNRWYRWVQNTSGAALAAGYSVCYDPASAANYYGKVEKPASALLNHFAGVAVSAIPDNGWGWILIEGQTGTAQIFNTNTSYAGGDIYKPLDDKWYVDHHVIGSINQNLASHGTDGSQPALLGRGYIHIQASVASVSASATTNVAAFVHCLRV